MSVRSAMQLNRNYSGCGGYTLQLVQLFLFTFGLFTSVTGLFLQTSIHCTCTIWPIPRVKFHSP